MTLTRYESDDTISTIVMDDGKVNALSPAMFRELNEGLDRAEAARNVVLITGRERRFSGGFDLGVFRQGKDAAVEMLLAGARTAERLLSFPEPVVIACSGHAIAMAAFLLTTADLRVGVDNPEVRIVANEVEIGLTVPHFVVELCRQRLTPAAFDRALGISHTFDPGQAVSAGFLDLVVPEAELLSSARDRALALSRLVRDAHTETKRRVRASALAALRRAIELDLEDWNTRLG
jgi:enoyl-CoA hydratase/carnithine racemase